MVDRVGAGRDVLWKLVDGVGLEHSRLDLRNAGPLISGTVLTTDGTEPVTIDYAVECDRYWHTREVEVQVRRARQSVPDILHLTADGSGEWNQLTESEEGIVSLSVPSIRGCIDVDLAFSPVTNTLPIRRHELVVGASARVTAAWVKFPSLEVTALPQRYTRVGPLTYRYESFQTNFTAQLDVDELGLVTSYEGLWERVTGAMLM